MTILAKYVTMRKVLKEKTVGTARIEHYSISKEEATEIEQQINDEKYKGYAAWDGYFSSLEEVKVENVAIINQ